MPEIRITYNTEDHGASVHSNIIGGEISVRNSQEYQKFEKAFTDLMTLYEKSPESKFKDPKIHGELVVKITEKEI